MPAQSQTFFNVIRIALQALLAAIVLCMSAEASTFLQGTVRFEDRAYNEGGWVLSPDPLSPARYVTLNVLRASDNAVLSTLSTTNAGNFSVTVAGLNAGDPYLVEVLAQTAAAVVTPDGLSPSVYSHKFGPFTSAAPNIVVLRSGATGTLARALNIVDAIIEGYQWAAARSGRAPDQIEVRYPSVITNWPSYVALVNNIYIPNDSVAESDDTILHEYGHFLWDNYTLYLASGSGDHSACSSVTPELAFSEAWGDWVVLAVRNKTWSTIAVNTQTVQSMIAIEQYLNATQSYLPSYGGTKLCDKPVGAGYELSVAALLSATRDPLNSPYDFVDSQEQKTWNVLSSWNFRLLAPTINDFKVAWANDAEMDPLFCNFIDTSKCLTPPAVSTGAASSILATSAVLGGAVNPNGAAATARFEYGTVQSSLSLSTPVVTLPASSSATVLLPQISGLTCGTTYYFRVLAYNIGPTFFGATNSFTTAACTPVTNSSPIANFTYSVSGSLVTFTDQSTDSDGQIVARSWNFGDSTNSSNTNPTKAYSAPGIYYVVLTVTDNVGATGTKLQQVTIAPVTGVPVVTTNAATAVSSTSATFNATISNDGGSPILDRRFEWDTSPNWTSSTASNFYGGNIVVAGNNFSYVFTTLVPSTTYYFRAYAKNANGWTMAGTQSFMTQSGLDQTPPTVPTFLLATAISSGQINLSWQASTDTGGSLLAGYKIERCAGTGCANFVQIGAIGVTSYSDSGGLSQGTTYQYRVRAFDTAGNNSLAFSNVASATTQVVATTTVPSVIAVAATNVTGTSATLNGTITFDGGSPTLERMFEWGPTPNITTVVTTSIAVSGSNFSYALTGLSANTSYTFRANARNSSGWSVVPVYLSFTTGPAPDTVPPSTPASLAAVAASTSQINLSWTASTDTGGSGLSGYRIERCTGLNCATFSQIGTSVSATYSDVTGLSSGTTYTYRVRAYDGLGNVSDYSLTANATTNYPIDTTPPTVSSVTPSAGATGVVVNGPISVLFSESIDYYTLTNASFIVKDASNNVVAGTPYVAGQFANFIPTANLAFNTTYTVTLTTAVKDYSGNPLASDYTWSFKTRTAAGSVIPKVTGPQTISTSYSVRPTIQKHGSNIYVVDSNPNRDLLFYKSTDGGASFSSVSLFNPVTNGDQYDFCKDGSGNLFVFYKSSTDDKVYIRRSIDSGISWSTQQALGTGFVWMDSQSCFASGGTLYVVFRAYLNLKIELYLTKSTDAGVTFSAPVQITNNTFQEDGARVAAFGNNVYVAYNDLYSASPTNIYLARSTDGGSTFGAGVRVNRTANKAVGSLSLTVDSSGNIYAAYGDNSVDTGDLYIAKSTNAGVSFTSTLATDSTVSIQGNPRIFVDSSNFLHVSWADYRSLFYGSVYYTRSTDGGLTYAANANLRSTDRLNNGSLVVDGGTTYLAVVDGATSPISPLLYQVTWLTGSVPGVPSNVVATAGNGTATVSFLPPADNGGNAIAGYTVTATPGGQSLSGAASPITFSGLSNGTPYSFSVTATNAVGNSTPSPQSNTVVPVAPLPPQCVLTASPTTITAGASSVLTVSCTPSATSYVWTNTGFAGAAAGGNVLPATTTTYFVSGVNAVGQGGAASATVTVLPATGSLSVNLGPANAVSAGAQWQLDGGAFQNSGATLSGLSAGSHTVSFKAVAGWTKPGDRTVVISAGQLLTDSASYVVVPVQFALTISSAGTGTGVIYFTGGFTCPALCSQSFDSGTMISLTATAAPGSTFAGWTGGGCAGVGICTVTLTAVQTVTATFNLPVVIAPSPPQSISAIAGNGTIAISFLPPISDGGAAISNYTVRCNAGAVIASNIASPILLSGLTNGAAYSCTVTASNSAGDSLPSALVSAIPQGQLALSGVFSRKTHGSAGVFDLTIDLTKQISGPVTVEPRSISSGHNIVFQFNQPVTSLGTVAVVDGQGASVSFAPTIVGNEIVITLTGPINGKRVAISISGVNGAGVATAAIGFLLGDVNESRLVDINDVRIVRARSGQIANGTNFRFDINASGVISGGDIAAVKVRSGNALQ